MQSVLRLTREIVVNIALPFAIYQLMHGTFGDVKALLASSAPPTLWSIAELVRHRRADALSLLVLSGIALSLLAYVGGGSVRFLQLRERLVTVLIALVFLGSAAIGRPLMYELVRAFLARTNSPELKRVESLRENKFFRHGMTVMTVVWGFGLLADAAASIALTYVLSIRLYLVVNPILGYATIGSLTLWNLWYGRRMRRRGEARLAAAQAPAPAVHTEVRDAALSPSFEQKS
jgi:hypothetical protein